MSQVPDNPVKNRTELSYFYYTIAAVLFILAYLTANLMAVKIVAIGDLALFDAGTIIYPFSYMLGDVLSEIWGYRGTRRVILLAVICNVLLVLFTGLGTLLPTPDYNTAMSEAYGMVFSYAPRILIASVLAFCVGELVNAATLVKIRQWTGSSHLWMRTIGSSVVGHLLDTGIFVVVAFAGTCPPRDLLTMIVIQYPVKVAIEAAFGTPMAYAAVAWLRKRM